MVSSRWLQAWRTNRLVQVARTIRLNGLDGSTTCSRRNSRQRPHWSQCPVSVNTATLHDCQFLITSHRSFLLTPDRPAFGVVLGASSVCSISTSVNGRTRVASAGSSGATLETFFEIQRPIRFLRVVWPDDSLRAVCMRRRRVRARSTSRWR